MRIDHAQLRALAAVIREGSFERAALALNVTASAVSQRIKALEERVGKLLVRRTTPTEATAEGQVLVRLAEQTALLERDAFERIGLSDADLPRASIPVAVNHDSMETWFPEAALAFAKAGSTTLDLHTEDQDHTVALLRQGAVLGAVTTLSEPVQGCQIHALGSMRYAATCTPEFHARHFAKGVTAQALAQAPVLVFNRKDDLQARYAQRLTGSQQSLHAPTWWIPSTRAFVHANLGGLGWTMNPLPLVRRHLDSGRLVYVKARAWEDIPLYWQHWKGEVASMAQLTRAILQASSTLIRKRR
ncbi:MAG: LysR family transcriptional regulator ArgP [Stenotrophomonas nitritireducens]|uniref:LysR family transcriptional regulator ArgP n=1 Tax=Stenotrophomonas TaxID=40323 RepID=UPI001AC101A3|nr:MULTISPECIES: LysR family transcriptional regulator ArgP [Stenotrophomonas]MBN8790864.1 LysR family transcriptional regulator ArgP [Stenotrophomonas nitritireducens]MBN8796745.1 LysR family transcriptional regulator ArgP [Stenotrophomonas nitritireducens]